jgi:predicted dithiol-disulfide oxidoreductase (DUF899 family)
MAYPEVVSREQWLEARVRLLAEEKDETRRRDALNAKRRRLPMVRVGKEYVFEGPGGPVSLTGLFGDSSQLIIHHVMFGPDWDAACPSCTNFVDELSDGLLAHLRSRDTAFALISRTPLAKIGAYQASRGWTVPWYSSYGSDFNYDFQVTLDRSVPQCGTTTGPNQACSAASSPPRCRVPAASCATAAKSSTPIRPSDEATSTPPASIPCST